MIRKRTYITYRASGLGRACVVDICRAGGFVAILDMNEELAQELVKEIGQGKTKFFETNVLQTESIAAAVEGTLEWVKETGKPIAGVIAAAGVSTPAKVCHYTYYACLFKHGRSCGRNFRGSTTLRSIGMGIGSPVIFLGGLRHRGTLTRCGNFRLQV